MPITLNDLSVAFDGDDRARLLEDWRWLVDADWQPILLTIAGDVFVQSAADHNVHFLNCMEGVIEKVADDMPEFMQRLNETAFVVAYFQFDLVAPLLREGQRPGAGQAFTLKVPPVLGGEVASSNLEATDVAVYLSLAGQIHQQVANLPPGSPVTDITFMVE